VPAAAVIPAPIAYIKVVAVKKLVVGKLAPAYIEDPSSQYFGSERRWLFFVLFIEWLRVAIINHFD
jgi:hypothetical protein